MSRWPKACRTGSGRWAVRLRIIAATACRLQSETSTPKRGRSDPVKARRTDTINATPIKQSGRTDTYHSWSFRIGQRLPHFGRSCLLEAVVSRPIADGVVDRQTEASIIKPSNLPTIIFTSGLQVGVRLLHSEKDCLNFIDTTCFAHPPAIGEVDFVPTETISFVFFR